MRYENKSLKDLRNLAEERNISTEGTRRELAERLYAEEYKDVPVRYVLPHPTEEPPVKPSVEYNPAAWREGDSVKVAYQFSGRLTVEKAEYFHEETRRHAGALGLTVDGEPGLLFQQGAVTVFTVRVK
jgi:hypothetical protein